MNPLAENFIKHGMPMVAVRKALRDFHSAMIALPVGSTCGVHGVGVFYTYETAERWIVRGPDLVHCPARTVLKLRPASSSTSTIETETDLVQISISFTGVSNSNYRWTSASRAARFTCTQPTHMVGTVYHLVRSKRDGRREIVMVRDVISNQAANSTIGPVFSGTGPFVLDSCRVDQTLQSVIQNETGTPIATRQPTFEAKVGASLRTIEDPIYGRKALAWIRQRTIALSER